MSIFSQSTICAVSTPPGMGGIAVIRVSGDEALDIVQRLWRGKPLAACPSHTVHLGTVTEADGTVLDQCVATVYRAPHSFTGEDVVELAVHGSRYIQQQLINALIDAGAKIAAPGEFTRRAFSSGKFDLAQAEAIADIISSEGRAAHRIAMQQMRGHYSQRLRDLREQLLTLASLLELELDFSEEDVEFASRAQLLQLAHDVQYEVKRLADSFNAGSAIKNGIPVAIIGQTNAGKSSLLNALLNDDRAIVSDIHGTTRDIVEDTLNIGDYTFRLMDTAGLRSTHDHVENLGIKRSLEAAAKARILLIVIDSTAPVQPDIPDTDASIITVINKTDLPQSDTLATLTENPKIKASRHVNISAKTGEGISALQQAMQDIAIQEEDGQSSVLVTNARHYQALLQAHQSITRAISAIESSLSGDLIAMDIRLTISSLNEILGEITSQDILSTVFSRFCIGK